MCVYLPHHVNGENVLILLTRDAHFSGLEFLFEKNTGKIYPTVAARSQFLANIP